MQTLPKTIEFYGHVRKAIQAVNLLMSNSLVMDKDVHGKVWRPIPVSWDDFAFFTRIDSEEIYGLPDENLCKVTWKVTFYLNKSKLAEVTLTSSEALVDPSPEWWTVKVIKYAPTTEDSPLVLEVEPLSDGSTLMTW